MKYTIEGFDQELLVKWGLDSNDAIILRWFVDFYLSGKMAKVEHDGETYLWINYQTCIDDLPIMRIKNKEVLARHFKKFEQCGLMKRHISRKGGIYTCFKLVEKEYIKLIEKVERSTENRRVDFKVGNERPKSREDVDSKVETKDSSIKDSSINNPNILNIYCQNNFCPNCKSKVRIKNKRSGEHKEVLFCETCKCEFLPLNETEIEVLINGTDFEAIECYDKYFDLHPNAENIFYEKSAGLKMFQNILNRCRVNGKNDEAKEIVIERLENYFENEFYEKVNWSIESFVKNFNAFAEKQVYYSEPKYLNKIGERIE